MSRHKRGGLFARLLPTLQRSWLDSLARTAGIPEPHWINRPELEDRLREAESQELKQELAELIFTILTGKQLP